VTKFCLSVDIHDIITCATFCDDRLRGLGVARAQISRFPIDLRRRPYNTLALPCECVMASDLHTLSDMNVLMKYADDTNLLVPAYSGLELACEFDNVKQWAAQTRMVTNKQRN